MEASQVRHATHQPGGMERARIAWQRIDTPSDAKEPPRLPWKGSNITLPSRVAPQEQLEASCYWAKQLVGLVCGTVDGGHALHEAHAALKAEEAAFK